jgi:hypothetical protein
MKRLVMLALSIACLAFTAVEKAHALSTYYAVVNPAGATLHGSGAVSSTRVATGRYNIKFARKVSDCSAVASITATTRGFASASPHPNATGTFIQVYTFGPTGTAANQNFTVMVTCPPTVVVRRGDASVSDGSTSSISVPCEPGETAIGGGADLVNITNNTSDSVVMSRPDRTGIVPADGEAFTGWRGTARNPTGGPGVNTLRVYALCVQ